MGWPERVKVPIGFRLSQLAAGASRWHDRTHRGHAMASARRRTGHGEGRGFESLHPLHRKLRRSGAFVHSELIRCRSDLHWVPPWGTSCCVCVGPVGDGPGGADADFLGWSPHIRYAARGGRSRIRGTPLAGSPSFASLESTGSPAGRRELALKLGSRQGARTTISTSFWVSSAGRGDRYGRLLGGHEPQLIGSRARRDALESFEGNGYAVVVATT